MKRNVENSVTATILNGSCEMNDLRGSDPTKYVDSTMTSAMKQQLIERFQAMTIEEMELFMSIVPIDLCMRRIQNELDKAKEFENAIKIAMNVVR